MLKPLLSIIVSIFIVVFTSQSVAAKQVHGQNGTKKNAANKVSNGKGPKASALRNKRSAAPSRVSAPKATVRSRMMRKVVMVHGKRKVVYQRVSYAHSMAAVPGIQIVHIYRPMFIPDQ